MQVPAEQPEEEGEERGPVAARACAPAAACRPVPLPPRIARALWRASELGSSTAPVLATGFAALDVELPGGGWPCRCVTELLQPQASVAEWRLLAPAMREVAAAGHDIIVVGSPLTPHLPGLLQSGLDERRLVWIRAETPTERLWAIEQLVRADAAGLLVAWLPQARPEQIRRLQVAAEACSAPVFLCRPAAAAHEASVAPLRVQLHIGLDWELQVQLLKRKGAPHDGLLRLVSVLLGLQRLLTPRLRRLGALIAARCEREFDERGTHAVGRAASRRPAQRPAAAR